MGYNMFDQYSFLHFCIGAILYYWQVPFNVALAIHIAFELLENTPQGMQLINALFVRQGMFGWPGGKDRADAGINMVGDNISFAVGWYVARRLDIMGYHRKWYRPTLG